MGDEIFVLYNLVLGGGYAYIGILKGYRNLSPEVLGSSSFRGLMPVMLRIIQFYGEISDRKIVSDNSDVGVARIQDAHGLGQVLLVQVDGRVESARGLVGVGEVVARGQGVEVVGSQDTLAVDQGPLE